MFSQFRSSSVFVAILVAAVVVAGTGVAAAQAATVAQADEPAASGLYEQFAGMTESFNEGVADVDLGPAGDRLAGRTANVYVDTPEGREGFSFAMDERNRITNLQPRTVEDADLRMVTDRTTVRAIASADAPAAAFRDAYRTGDVTIRADFGAVEAATSGRLLDWGFWTAADLFKGLL